MCVLFLVLLLLFSFCVGALFFLFFVCVVFFVVGLRVCARVFVCVLVFSSVCVWLFLVVLLSLLLWCLHVCVCGSFVGVVIRLVLF